MSQARIAQKRTRRALWPVMGLILAIALGAIAWLAKDPVMAALPANVRTQLGRLPGVQGEVAVAAFLFLIMLGIVAIVVALAAPRKRINVKDQDMLKERDNMLRDKAARERLAKKMAQENRKSMREDAKRKSNFEDR
ncbi:MAG: hypothetical protein IT320_03605 [Anaerolineae bacterium]|nr:hypothetical protein [Anaerolineae bacterium]